MTRTLFRIAVLAATIGSFVFAADARAQATITPFGSPETLTDTATDDCRGGVAGSLTGTSTTSGQFVDTFPPAQGFHYHGTETGSYRIAFVDGSWAVGTFTGHFDGGGPINPQGIAFYTSTSTVLDKADVYGPGGTLLGTETVHVVAHTNGQDVPPMGPSDNDIVRVSFDTMRLTCSV